MACRRGGAVLEEAPRPPTHDADGGEDGSEVDNNLSEPAPRRRRRAVARPSKQDPALESFSKCPVEERVREFWKFVIEAVSGEASDEPFCREYDFGGILPFIADVGTVIREVLIPFHADLGEQLWRVMVVVWLGGGGPGFRTYRHVTEGTPLCGEGCAESAMLPALNSERDVADMFEHLRRIAARHGRHAVLSGDGSCVKFRLGERQGVAVLRDWRRCVRDLMAKVDSTAGGLRALGTRAIFEHFHGTLWLGSLSIKEIFCYLYPAHPQSVDVDEFVPVGAGAERGGSVVLGIAQGKGVDWHGHFLQMTKDIPLDLKALLSQAIAARAASCPFRDDPRVPGVGRQLHRAQATAADVEVCMCFFMNFLKAKRRGRAPKGWQMLKRSLWNR